MTSTEETLSNLLKEDRRFEPPEELAADANVKEEAYARAEEDPEAFWAEQAERLHWDTEVGPGARLVEPAVRQVVRRRHPQRGVQLPRPARRERPR